MKMKHEFLKNAEIVEIGGGFAVFSSLADEDIFVAHFKTRVDALQAVRLATKVLKSIYKAGAYSDKEF